MVLSEPSTADLISEYSDRFIESNIASGWRLQRRGEAVARIAELVVDALRNGDAPAWMDREARRWIDSYRLAEAFVDRLTAELGADAVDEIRDANRETDSPTECASQSRCDANVAMSDAFVAIVGRRPDLNSRDDLALWCGAWDLALS